MNKLRISVTFSYVVELGDQHSNSAEFEKVIESRLEGAERAADAFREMLPNNDVRTEVVSQLE